MESEDLHPFFPQECQEALNLPPLHIPGVAIVVRARLFT
jgi:hypothetical protein